MKGLDTGDIRLLKKSFLQKLNEESDGNEERCLDRTKIFHAIGLEGYNPSVVPFIVQALIGEGLVRECGNVEQVRITHQGKQRLTRNIENNMYVILEILATEAPKDNTGRSTLGGSQLQEFTKLTPSEINDAVAILAESGHVETFRALGTYPFTFYTVTLTPRGRYEYQQRGLEERPKTEEKK